MEEKVVECPEVPSLVIKLPVDMIAPWHSPTKPDVLFALTESLRKHGWQGRPLLVYKITGGFRAITGSHRLAASKDASIASVPCFIIDDMVDSTDETGPSLVDRLRDSPDSPWLFATLCMFGAPLEVIGLMALDFLARPEPDFDPEKYDWRSLGRWMLDLWHSDDSQLKLPLARDVS